jgi:hypothetical protein
MPCGGVQRLGVRRALPAFKAETSRAHTHIQIIFSFEITKK